MHSWPLHSPYVVWSPHTSEKQTASQLVLLGPWLMCSVGPRARQAEEAHSTSGHETLWLQAPRSAVLLR